MPSPSEPKPKRPSRFRGEFALDPLGSEGTCEIASVPLKKYSPFYKDSVLFDIEDGRIDLSARYRYAKGQKEPEIDLSGISVSLNALRLKEAEEKGDFLKVPTSVDQRGGIWISQRESLHIGSLSTGER